MPPITLNDDGYLSVQIADQPPVSLDLYRTWSAVREMADRLDGRPDSEFYDELVQLLQSAGLPPLSHRAAERVYLAVRERVAELKNADRAAEQMPGSPASTEPTPSDCPPATS